jgi:hypothetical protein
VSDAAVHRTILEVLKEDELNKGDLTSAIQERLPRVSKKRIREQIDSMAEDGDIVMTAGAHNAKLYSLPSEAGK